MKPYYEDSKSGITIYHGDCREVVLSDIALVVTSPPYNCGKFYGRTDDSMSWDAYWQFSKEWSSVVLTALIVGGRLAVNLPWWMQKKPRLDVPMEFQRMATAAGFLYTDKIIWIKGNESNVNVSGGFGGGGSGWGTYMSPSGPSIRCATEPILIFSKEQRGRKAISTEGRGLCVRGDITKEEFLAWTIDAWFIRGGSNPEHPAVFPSEIPKRLIKLYTFPSETILDLFMGSGTSLQAAKTLGRKAIGIEIEEKYCEIAAKRLDQDVLNFEAVA